MRALFLSSSATLAAAVFASVGRANLPQAGPPRGIPFGFSRGPVSHLSSEFTGALLTPEPRDVRAVLDSVRAAGGHVVLNLSGKATKSFGPDGRFSLSAWEQRVDRFRHVDFSSYVADGTVVGHFLMDEPNAKKTWGGDAVPYSAIDSAAAYSESIWPDMPTVVRVDPVWLSKAPFRWRYLDAAWAQYVARKGGASQYRDENVAAAKSLGLGLVFGLNLLDGGDGSSRWSRNDGKKFGMSPQEVASYGKILAATPYACGLFMWRWDEDYLSLPGVNQALAEVAAVASQRPAQSCRVRPH